jgi:outer membrane protein
MYPVKSRFLSILLVSLIALPMVSVADGAQKIGIVDLQKALAATDSGKEAQKQYEGEVKRLQSQLDGKKSEYEKMQQGYQKQKASLNDKARAEKEELLGNTEKELKRTFQDSQDTLRRKNAQLVGELVNKMRLVIEDYGKSNGYSVILDRSGQGILYNDQSVDLTDQIVKAFNSKN